MPTYDKIYLANWAKELSVVRDTFEKVLRLCDILRFFDSSEYFRQKLALKGGTAINLLFFDLPRLSVDIDLDFCENVSREEMIRIRETIDERLKKHMAAAGYTLSPKSKMYHSLYSYVYEYINSGGVKDNIKIEINYSLRSQKRRGNSHEQFRTNHESRTDSREAEADTGTTGGTEKTGVGRCGKESRVECNQSPRISRSPEPL